MNKLISKIVGVALGLTLAGGTGAAIALNGNNAKEAVAASSKYQLCTDSSLSAGNYVFYYSGRVMKNTISSNRLTYSDVTPAGDSIMNPDASIVWTVAASGDYWTIYNSAVSKYAASNGTKNQAALASSVDDKALWSVSVSNNTFDFTNKYNNANSVNAKLRNNTTYGFACYAAGTGGALTLYKYVGEVSEPTLEVDKTSAYITTSINTTLTATVADGTGNVSWSTEDTDIISLSSTTGSSITVSGLAAGTATITVSYSTAPDVTVTITVYEVSHAGTSSDPFTVADARKMIDVGSGITDVYVSGIIYKIDEINTSYGNAQYWISDDGSSSNGLEVYRGKGLNNASFTSSDDLAINDEVVVYGTLTKYGSTYEFTSGNYLYSLERAAVVDTYGLAGYNYIYEIHDGTYYYMNIDNASASVKPTAVTDKLQASVFLFTLVATDTFTISNGDKTSYLYCTSGNNSVCWGSTSTTTWKVDNSAAGQLAGTYNLVSNVQDRCLCIYNNTDWRTYTSTTATNRKAKTEIEEFDYAQEFLTVYTLGCVQSGGYTAENMHWTEASRFYNYLSATDKAVFTNATADAEGSSEERVAARYDYIVTKYGSTTFTNFMSRSGLPASANSGVRAMGSNNSALIIVVITAFVSATFIGGYFLLRKKKEN